MKFTRFAAITSMALATAVTAGGIAQATPTPAPNPVQQEIRYHLTPDMNPAKAIPSLVRPVASPIEDQRAINMFASTLGVGTAVGTLVGTGAGVVIGALAGCVGTLSACPAGAITGAGLGGIVGTVLVGGPVLAVAATDLVSTLMAPPGTTKFEDKRFNPSAR